jgi:hypothetical protein
MDTSTDVGDVLQGPTTATHCRPCPESHTLGEYVAPHRRLQDVMRRVPPRMADLGLDGWAAGLHKVTGMTPEAVGSGVLHKFVS